MEVTLTMLCFVHIHAHVGLQQTTARIKSFRKVPLQKVLCVDETIAELSICQPAIAGLSKEVVPVVGHLRTPHYHFDCLKS